LIVIVEQSSSPVSESSQAVGTSERFMYYSDSYSSGQGSESSFHSNYAVPEDMFSNELFVEDTNTEIEKMLMSLEIDERAELDGSSEITPNGFVASESIENNTNMTQFNQLAAAQAYLAAMTYPMITPPIQYQSQNGITFVQMPFGGSLPANLSAQPVFVILPPIDPSAVVQNVPTQASSSSANLKKTKKSDSKKSTGPLPSSTQKSEEVFGNIRKLFRDQAGCRLLQQKLQEGDAKQVSAFYKESLQSISLMMTDPFGNYLFQKLLENGTSEQCTEMLKEIKDDLVDAALTIHGTRSVQKVLEVCKLRNQIAIIQQAIHPRVVDLCLDANGNHVIQKAVQSLSAKDKNFIYTAVMTNCKRIACHKHGCCVLQRCLDSASGEQQRALVGTIIFHALELMQDPYGNYVVQYVLDHGRQTEAWAVAQKCIGSVVLLSTQKFSSNVMEKCMEKANDQLLNSIVLELSAPTSLLRLLLDQFANYVIQRAISVAPVDIARYLVESIRPHLNVLKDSSGGRKIIAKITKRFPKIDGPSPAF